VTILREGEKRSKITSRTQRERAKEKNCRHRQLICSEVYVYIAK
jgi:hypothetical protein